MWKRFREEIGQSSFHTILFMVLILFTVVPLLLVQQLLVHVYEKNLIHNTCINVSSVMDTNNRKLDNTLKGIETTAQLMLNSDFYYHIFSELSDYTISDYLRRDREIRTELSRQFSLQPEVWDAYFYVPGWTLGDNHSPLSERDMERTGYAEMAYELKGGIHWITGYDYGETIQSAFLMNKERYDYQYLFTMVKEMNFQYSYQGMYYTLPIMEKKPVLVVHVKENDIRKLYENSIGYENSLYAIANKEGNVVSSSTDEFKVSDKVQQELFAYYGKSGYEVINYHGIRYLLCYATLENRDLFAYALVPMEAVTDRALADTRKLQYIVMLVMSILSVIVAYVLSRHFMRPIHALVEASERVGKAIFTADTPIPNQKEFRVLTESFNQMEQRIDKLIYENYEIRLREKENHLMALSLQINPHFLYNTLNTINIVALENDDLETSEIIISLSEMLQYTVRNQSEKGTLEDEIAWISNYLYIMSQRYHNLFRTDMDIDETVMNTKVPKLFFQPFLENSIIHGFASIDYMGILLLKIYRENDRLVVVISDNGRGMDVQKTNSWVNMVHKEGHVGISNVYQRLTICYGDKFDFKIESESGKGTAVTIQIPYEENN